MRTRTNGRGPGRRGFTLAEVAVTILIVGMGLVLVLQGLNTAKLTAAHTRNFKLARELALLTLGQVASGQFQDDIENGLQGSYAEEGFPDFLYEVKVGDEMFSTKADTGFHDSWAPTEEEEQQQSEEDPQDQEEEPFEKVRIRIEFPKVQELANQIVLEQWIPWKQVYGEKPEDEAATAAAQTPPAGGAPGSSNPTSGGGRP